jgi:hypothetical protein
MTVFRTKLRVKAWKYSEILKKLMDGQKINHPAPWPIYPQQIATKCARCGLDWGSGAMGYCCPHGNMCGFPLTAPLEREPLFISRSFDPLSPLYRT